MSETMMTTERRDEALPERWSAQRKTEVVLRVIRGEAIDEVAREIQVPVHEVEEWRRVSWTAGSKGSNGVASIPRNGSSTASRRRSAT